MGEAIVIGLIEAAPLILAATGFTIIYYLNGFINVAYGETVTIGAYITLVLNVFLGWNLYLALIPAALLAGLFSVVTFVAVFRPAFRRGVGYIEMIILSVGLSFLIRHGIRLIFGLQSYQLELTEPSYLTMFGTGVTSTQLLSIGLVAAVTTGLYLLVYKTRYGEQVRAFASNPELAMLSAINPSRVALLVWFIAGATAGLAGTFTATLAFVDFEIGWDMILILILISIVGGIGNVRGALAAGIVVGLVRSFVTIETATPIYGEVLLLAIFIIFLRLRRTHLTQRFLSFGRT